MIYPYSCQCGRSFDVIKPLSQIDSPEKCSSCGQIATRHIASGYFMGEKVEDAEYCPSLGCVVKSSAHRRAIAKERGLIEVGNEDMNKWNETVKRDKQAENDRFYNDIGTDRIILGRNQW